jgi:transcription elongation factor Elf1
MVSETVLGFLENELGKSVNKSKTNRGFKCKFCNHTDYKLEIDLNTDENGYNRWNCWSCNTRGRSIYALLKKLNVSSTKIDEIVKYLPKTTHTYKERNKSFPIINLPKEYKRLYVTAKSYTELKILRELKRRGLSDYDIIKYNIGFCSTGEYAGRVIIPSYNSGGTLNFFVGYAYEKLFQKYKNPELDKTSIVLFENRINWNEPIILVEGIFDAMTVQRNVIPLLGKTLPDGVVYKMIEEEVDKVYVMLDGDARKQAVTQIETLMSFGIRVYFVNLEDSDPNELGFKHCIDKLHHTEEVTLRTILKLKLNRKW